MRRNSSPDPVEVARRFWRKVDTSGDCWLWTGSRRTEGYGRFWMVHRRAVTIATHVAWELHNGPIPDGMVICHTCDNPPCVNPFHLFAGTKGDNNRDMRAKGRRAVPPFGAAHHNSKLNADLVRFIRANPQLSIEERARQAGVSKKAAWMVVHGVTWKHVEGATA